MLDNKKRICYNYKLHYNAEFVRKRIRQMFVPI